MMKFRLVENILESEDKSTIDKSYKQKEKYNLSDYSKEITNTESDGIRSVDIIWKNGSDKVAHVFTDIDKASDGNIWFGSLEVYGKYKSHGLSEQILDYIISNYNSNALAVAKDNEIAINLYKKYGFKINTDRTDDTYYYMYK